MKSLLFSYTEYLLLITVFVAGYSLTFYINPICTGVMLILLFQILFKSRVLGLTIGISFLIISLLFLLALFSEVSEFTQINKEVLQLLFVGIIICTSTTTVSAIMISKYSKKNINHNTKAKRIIKNLMS